MQSKDESNKKSETLMLRLENIAMRRIIDTEDSDELFLYYLLGRLISMHSADTLNAILNEWLPQQRKQ